MANDGFIDVLSPSALKDLQTLNVGLEQTITKVKTIGDLMKNVKSPSGSDSAIKNLTVEYEKQERIIKQLQTQLTNLAKAKAQNNARTSEEIVNQRALAAASDRQARSVSPLVGAYTNLSNKHAQAKKTLQDLIVSGKKADETQSKYNQRLQTAQKEFQGLNTRVLAADRAVGVFNRNVGNYPNRAVVGIRNLASAFGLFTGVYLFATIIKDAFSVIKNFDKATADLAATLGKSRKEIQLLTDDAKRLGAITKYTASEISGLQKELGKLGFSQTEILNSTEAISSLASAVDTDLSNAAAIAGTTLRAFGLDASEMGRVVDVMAKSFTSSALDITKYKESIKYVAPIAAAANVSLEQTTALLGILADNGISGSQAGTSLRRIMTDIVKTGKPFNEGLRDIVKNGISVKDAFDEVGRTAQTSLIVLGKNIPKIDALAVSLDNAAGAAKRMSDEQLNSLEGDIEMMTSAWEGFLLSVNKGDGAISKFVRNAIQGITEFTNFLTLLNTSKKNAGELVNEKELVGQKTLLEELNKIKKKGIETDEEIIEISKSKRKYAEQQIEGIGWEINALVALGKEQQKNIADIKKRNKLYGYSSVYHDEKNALAETNEKIKEASKTLGFYRGVVKGTYEYEKAKIKAVNEEKNIGIENTKEQIKALQNLAEERRKNAFARGISDLERQKEINSQRIEAETTYTKEKIELEEWNYRLSKEINEKTYLENLRLHKDSLDLQLIDANNYRTKSEKNEEEHQKRIAKIKIDNFDAFVQYREKYGRPTDDEETFGEGVTFLPTDQLDELIKCFEDSRKGAKETKDEIDALRQSTDAWINSFSEGFFSDAGLPTLFKVLNGEIDGFGEKWEETFLAISEITQEALSFLTQSSNAYFENQLSQLATQRDVAIAFAGDSATAKEEIERQYDERTRQIRRKQAQEEKKMAMFNIAINTAQAIVATLAKTPLPVGLPFVIATAAIGAAQLALTASAPLPQFYKGTDNAPEGWAYTQEKGREIITDKSGKIKSLGNDSGPQLTYMNKGDKVYTAEQSQLMFNNDLNNILAGNNISMPKVEINMDTKKITDKLDTLTNVISNKEGITIIEDARGRKVFQRKDAARKELLNNVLTYKGYEI